MSKYLMVPPGFEPDSSSDSEPEPNQYIIKPSVPLIEAPELLSSSSDEEDSDEPITGPESESEGSDPKIMPGPSDSAAGKIPVVDGKASEAEKRKKKSYQFNRFFPEEDEIVLLNGMIPFAEKNECGPLADLDAFRKFVKADLKVDPTTEQLRHKIYKFKTKYKKNLGKETSGKARSLTAHERRAYELSKLAWANEYIKNQKSSRGQKAAGKRAKAKGDEDLAAGGGGPSKAAAAADVGMEIVSVEDGSDDKTNSSRIAAQLFQKGKGVEEELEWAELMKAEMRVYLKKVELMHTKTSHELDVLNSKN